MTGEQRPHHHLPERSLSRWWLYGLPVLVCLALCIPKLWQGGWSTDTPWYAAIALDSYRSREFWTLPGIGDQPYFNKPPLAFWINGLPLALLGPTVLAARLGSVLACVVSVLSVTHLARRASGSNLLALWTGVILSLTWEFIRHGRSFSLDLWVVAFLLIGLVGVAEAMRSRKGRWLLLLGVGVGLSLLTKPLVGLVVFPIVGIWLAIERKPKLLVWLVPSLLVALVVTAPWHLAMWLQHGDGFTDQYFGREIADRAAAAGTNLNQQSDDWFFYPQLIVQAYWPWLITLVLAMIALFVRSTPAQHKSALRFIAIWSIVWLVALSMFADKRPRYALVLYPLWAWASAIWLTQLAPAKVRDLCAKIVTALPVVAIVLLLALSLLPIRMHRGDAPQWPALHAKLAELGAGSSTPPPPLPDVYAGALVGQRAARLYLENGRWPIATFNDAGELVHSPTAGSLVLYHRRDGRAPGANETVVWTMDDLTLTRLNAEPWVPVPTADPGE